MIGPDEQLALAYAPARLRAEYTALLEFDAILGQAFKATNEVSLIQIRLAWWRDQLDRWSVSEPVAASLHALMTRHNIGPDAFKTIIDGWAVLLDDLPYTDLQLAEYARQRGGGLFAVAARLAGGAADDRAGAGWALSDFARHCSHAGTAMRALALARDALHGNVAARLPKSMRSFAILARFAQGDCKRSRDEQRVAGSPHRIIQAIGFTLFAC
ncbi:MAG: squalene/phytoene synthase family protein [Pseudomonadota bacterium]